MNIFEHELAAYVVEINHLKTDQNKITKAANITHAMLSHSNRSNYVLVGLCSLVEAFLYDRASEIERREKFKFQDIQGNGLSKLKLYLSRVGIIDFGQLRNWEDFRKLSEVRNSIVHSYGGLVEMKDKEKVIERLSVLGFSDCWVANKRIRMNCEALLRSHAIVCGLFTELNSWSNKSMDLT